VPDLISNPKMYLFIFEVLALIFVISIAGIFILVKRYESQASKNIVINISKRIAAELGALWVKYIHDPGYEGWSEGRRDVSFGPKDGNRFPEANTEGLCQFLAKEFKGALNYCRNHKISEYARNFDYESFENPQLRLLRDEYHLDKLTEGIDEEIEKIILLRNWVKNRWEHGTPKDVAYNFNALDILSRAEKGEKFFCSEYSTVFVQCALSIGLQARYVGLFKGHVVAEVWSNDLAKWVVMDVDNDLHYIRNGIPLNALELHDAWVTGKWDEVQAMVGLKKRVADEKGKKDLLSFYHEFYIRMRNDWFSKKYPHWHPKANSIMNSLAWKDTYTSNNVPVSKKTEDKERIYFSLNVTSLNVIKDKTIKNRIYLILKTFTPNFSHFLIQIDDNKSIKQEGSVMVWNIHGGQNKLKCQAVNSLGVKGPPSEVKFVI